MPHCAALPDPAFLETHEHLDVTDDAAEVAMSTTKNDCWAVVNGEVLYVTTFASEHPGGDLDIFRCTGTGASEEFCIGCHCCDILVAGGGYTREEVANHAAKADCWVFVNGVGRGRVPLRAPWRRARDPHVYGPRRLGGVLLRLPAGRSHQARPRRRHYIVGGGGGRAAVDGLAAVALPTGMSAYALADVAKHAAKTDCWVVIHGEVLNVIEFLSEHPSGELEIFILAVKDASEEFGIIHPPDVMHTYAPDAISVSWVLPLLHQWRQARG